MTALSSRPFCPGDGHQAGLWYLPARWRYTTQKSMPTQLTLWQTFLPGDPKTEDYSNTVELYDAVPKYFASKKRMAEQRKDGRFLNSLKQPFRHKGKDYVVKITPARIEEKDGSEKEYALIGFRGLMLQAWSEKHNSFLRPLKKKGFKEERVTTIGLYDIGKSHDPGIQQEPAQMGGTAH